MPADFPFTEKRPWGEFRQFTAQEPVIVKTILVRSGERTSLQHHSKRSEFWRVLAGEPEITIGTEKIIAHEGDEFTVSIGTPHRIAAPRGDCEILEISRGEFNEADIIRTEDDYGRS